MLRRLAGLALLIAGPAFAADPGAFDWPQWRGPDRTGLSKETGLLKSWPEKGPTEAWRITGLGDGYSTPSVSAGRIYVMGTKEGEEYVICLDEKDGARIWEAKVGQKEKVGYSGPRSTPTINEGFAYSVASDGTLACVEIGKGEVKWQKNYMKDFGGKHGYWAYAESPLVDGDLVIGTPGAENAAVVAFNKKTGEVVWKTSVAGLERKPPDPKSKAKGGASKGYAIAGYSSVVVAEIGGIKQYVQFLDGGVVGVNAKDGKVLWHYEEPANSIANITTPIIRGDHVFAVTAYSTGAGLAKIVKSGDGLKAEPQYFVSKFQNHHGGVVLVKNHLYGTTGSLLCVEFETGKIIWEERSVGKGAVTFADGHLYVRGENGKVALVEANPAKYVEKSQFMQPDRSKQQAWPHPVIANGKLYIRDWDLLLCYDVKAK
jgi:outer membrane protein assembly factor BamB